MLGHELKNQWMFQDEEWESVSGQASILTRSLALFTHWLIRRLVFSGNNLCADSRCRENLQQERMADPTINDMRFTSTALECRDTRLDFR